MSLTKICTDTMILSASGWRKVFAVSGSENDRTPEIGDQNTLLSMMAAEAFADYIIGSTGREHPVIVCGTDTRPTGPAIADAVIQILAGKKISVRYAGITAAPEIMAYSKKYDGFIYISASHNPIGHNGLKFGINDGGVISGSENAKLTAVFKKRCLEETAAERISKLAETCSTKELEYIHSASASVKQEAVAAYRSFILQTVTGSTDPAVQNKQIAAIRTKADSMELGVVCDMNGSARTLSIDRAFLEECGIRFYTINDRPGEIVHAIIPEPENLTWCAEEMERLQKNGNTDAILGYMPDCDGDRGNIVYWDEKKNKASILGAQEVFSLSVLSELAFSFREYGHQKDYRPAIAVNGPTSLRINEIAAAFNATVFRAEVGEANVVNLAREKRKEGYTVRILGEGSNGGNITHPAAVRDPLNTLFALIKLLLPSSGSEQGLFDLWRTRSQAPVQTNGTASMSDIQQTLPAYVTTGVSEPRAVLHIKETDHAALKRRFQKLFLQEWEGKKENLNSRYGISSYEVITTNGTKETVGITDFGISGRGGLKIQFLDNKKNPVAFIWMRGSGTEPVFRIMSDVKGSRPDMEAELLAWETQLVQNADRQSA